MNDPVSIAARATAERLIPDYGPGLAADVEAALYTRGLEQRLERYFDPVSLGTLIVSIATLAWTIYTGLKTKTANPAPDIVTRTVRVELRKHTIQQGIDRITEVVVTEIIQAAEDPGISASSHTVELSSYYWSELRGGRAQKHDMSNACLNDNFS